MLCSGTTSEIAWDKVCLFLLWFCKEPVRAFARYTRKGVCVSRGSSNAAVLFCHIVVMMEGDVIYSVCVMEEVRVRQVVF